MIFNFILPQLIILVFYSIRGFQFTATPLTHVVTRGFPFSLILFLTLQKLYSLNDIHTLLALFIHSLIYFTFTFQVFAVTQRSVSLNLLIFILKSHNRSAQGMTEQDLLAQYHPKKGFEHVFDSRLKGILKWGWIHKSSALDQPAQWQCTPLGQKILNLRTLAMRMLFLKRGQYGWTQKTLTLTIILSTLGVLHFGAYTGLCILTLGCTLIVIAANLMNSISFQIMSLLPLNHDQLLLHFNPQESLRYRLKGLLENELIQKTSDQRWVITQKGIYISTIFHYLQKIFRFKETG